MCAFGCVASARPGRRESRNGRPLSFRRHYRPGNVRHKRVEPSIDGIHRRGAQSSRSETVHETGGAKSRVPELRVASENTTASKNQFQRYCV